MMGTTALRRAAADLLDWPAAPGPDPARILVALLVPIGDVLFCQPAIAALRRRYPQARIDALATVERADLIAMLPEFDAVIRYDDAPERGALARLDATLTRLAADPYGLVVSFSTAGNGVALLSGIPRQLWQRLPFLFWLVGAAFDAPYRRRHAVEQYWDVVAPLGITPRGPADHLPRWPIPPADRAASDERLRLVDLAPDGDHPLILIQPGAAGFGGRKRWPADRFGAVAAQLSQAGCRLVILGGPTDRPLAARIVAAAPHAVNFAGALSVRESLGLIARADCYIGNDSGLTHFAIALDVPTVAIFGVSSLEQFAPRPVDPTRLRLLMPQPVRPPTGYFIGVDSIFFPPRRPPDDRMLTITTDTVLAAVQALIARPTAAGSVTEIVAE